MNIIKHIAVMLLALLVVAVLAGCGGGGTGASYDALGLIVFESGSRDSKDIHLMRGNGLAQRLVVANGEQPCLSPASNKIAFVRGNDIFTINTDGTGLTNLTSHEDADLVVPEGILGCDIETPAFSPTGDKIAYTSTPVVPEPTGTICIMNTDGTGRTTVVTNADHPAFSPDGNKIVFVRDEDIFTINTDGTGLIRLTDHGGVLLSLISYPVFSPAGDKIAYASTPVGGPVPVGTVIIHLINADGTGGDTVVTDGDHPTFSPDGSRIVFVRDGSIFSTDQSGTDVIQLTDGPDDGYPNWAQ